MPSYRCYFVDAHKSYWDARTIESANAESAIAEALKVLPEKPRCTRVEIWDEKQVVYREDRDAGGPPRSRRAPVAKSFKILIARCLGRPEFTYGR